MHFTATTILNVFIIILPILSFTFYYNANKAPSYWEEKCWALFYSVLTIANMAHHGNCTLK